MFQSYTLLPTYSLQKHTPFYHPERPNDVVSLESSARNVFTDFMNKPPETTRPDATLEQALNQMIVTKVKSLLVIDENEDVVGLISSKHIHSPQVPMIAKQQDTSAKELSVSAIMSPVDKLQTIDLKDLQNARVGHIARLIHDLGVQHLLVIERSPDGIQQTVRGVFSASRLSRQLGMPVLNDLSSHSLADMNKIK
jgi:predicted transcriptional regulator